MVSVDETKAVWFAGRVGLAFAVLQLLQLLEKLGLGAAKAGTARRSETRKTATIKLTKNE